jgi:hypothetical protein
MEYTHIKRKMIRGERKTEKRGEKARKKGRDEETRTKMNDFSWGGEEGCYKRKASQESPYIAAVFLSLQVIQTSLQ